MPLGGTHRLVFALSVLLVGCATRAGMHRRSAPPNRLVGADPAANELEPERLTRWELLSEVRWWLVTRVWSDTSRERFRHLWRHAPSSYRGLASCDLVLESERPIPFRLRPGAPPFGEFHGELVRVLVPLAPGANRFYLAAHSPGIVVYGVARPGDLVFRPAVPLEFGGIVALDPWATIAVAGTSKPGRLRVSYPLVSDEEVSVTPMTLEKDVDCNDVTLATRTFTHDLRPGLGEIRYVLGPGSVLAREPGGAAFARIRPGHRAWATVIESANGYHRVVVYRQTDSLVGWTRDALETPPGGTGFGWGSYSSGRGAGSGTGLGFLETIVTCPRDVPLWIEQGTGKEVVGSVLAGTRMILFKESANHFVIRIDSIQAFVLAEGASLAMHKRDLEGCSKVGREKKPPPEHRPGPWVEPVLK